MCDYMCDPINNSKPNQPGFVHRYGKPLNANCLQNNIGHKMKNYMDLP